MRLRHAFFCVIAAALASFAEYEVVVPVRIGVIEAEMLLYDVSAGGIFEYRDDWSAIASRRASVSDALGLAKAGHSPVVLPDAGRSQVLFNLKARMRYHCDAFRSDFFSFGRDEGDIPAFFVGALDSLCDRFGVDGFLYTFGYEEKFSPQRRRLLMSVNGSVPPERTFRASILAGRDGRVLWYEQASPEPLCAAFLPPSVGEEGIHTESLAAQSKAMERRFANQNLYWADRDLEDYLDEVLNKLSTPEERRRYNLRVRILRGDPVDAFAAPDGTIYICTGLLARTVNEAQVAAILAHELAHVVGGHAEKNLRMLKEASRVQAMQPSTAPEKSKSAPAAKPAPTQRNGSRRPSSGFSNHMMFSGVAESVRTAFHGYQRELESEADSVAKVRLAAAGYPPVGDFRQFIENVISIHNTGASEGDDIEKGYFNIKMRSVTLSDAAANHAAGRHGWTELQLDKLLSIDECDRAALLIRGDMERMLSPRSTAWAEWYEKALRCDPQDPAALRATGFAYHAIGDKPKAREYLGRYSELYGDAPDIKMVREALRQCE